MNKSTEWMEISDYFVIVSKNWVIYKHIYQKYLIVSWSKPKKRFTFKK